MSIETLRVRSPCGRLAGTVAALLAMAASTTGAGERAPGTACAGRGWVGAWAAPPSLAGAGLLGSDIEHAFSDQTLRLNVTPLRSGRGARVRLSNRFGTQAVMFDRVYLGKQDAGARLRAGSNRRVRFAGSTSVTVPAGAEVSSDQVAISVRAFEHLAVSIYVAGSTGPATQDARALQTSFVTPSGLGDRSAQEGDDGFSLSITARPFLTEIETRAPRRHGVLVAVGDSITDGTQSSPTLALRGVDEDARYPDLLARRLNEGGSRFAVLNAGIGGNAILTDGQGPFAFAGPSLLARLDTDVIQHRRLTDVILLAGINDLGLSAATSEGVIQGLEEAITRLHAVRTGARRRLNVLVGTIAPSGGALLPPYATADLDVRRQQINDYIRTSGIGDGVVDFDQALRDPSDPSRLAPEYDSGDGLHPSSAGYQRMAEEVDLSALAGPECRRRGASK